MLVNIVAGLPRLQQHSLLPFLKNQGAACAPDASAVVHQEPCTSGLQVLRLSIAAWPRKKTRGTTIPSTQRARDKHPVNCLLVWSSGMLHTLTKLRGNICPQKQENKAFPSWGQAGAPIHHLQYGVMDTGDTPKKEAVQGLWDRPECLKLVRT